MVGPALIVMLTAGLIATFVTAFALTGSEGEETIGEATPPPSETVEPPPGDAFTITAVSAIKFDQKDLTIPAGQTVAIVMDNQDRGIPHNFAVYLDDGFKQVVAKTDICTAPCEETLTLESLQPGEYYFQCDVHPVASMRGTLQVE
jgi:plastocyanin